MGRTSRRTPGPPRRSASALGPVGAAPAGRAPARRPPSRSTSRRSQPVSAARSAHEQPPVGQLLDLLDRVVVDDPVRRRGELEGDQRGRPGDGTNRPSSRSRSRASRRDLGGDVEHRRAPRPGPAGTAGRPRRGGTSPRGTSGRRRAATRIGSTSRSVVSSRAGHEVAQVHPPAAGQRAPDVRERALAHLDLDPHLGAGRARRRRPRPRAWPGCARARRGRPGPGPRPARAARRSGPAPRRRRAAAAGRSCRRCRGRPGRRPSRPRSGRPAGGRACRRRRAARGP